MLLYFFDEIKIKEDLVWDKHSGEESEYVDSADANVNYITC